MTYTKYLDNPQRRGNVGDRDHFQHIENGLLAVSNNVGGNPYDALDIWPAFNANGGSGSWNALTYTDYIAGLDASLQGGISSGTVVKADLGASSGTEHIYSYAAGNGPVNVLLVGGQHGNETLGIWAAMRWFQEFATSNDAQMRQMRNAFRVTWIPVLNASRYRQSRVNSNGVDPNRNYNLLWSRYTPAGASDQKGDSPFDQPESQAVKALLDNRDFRVVIDCHNYSGDGDTMAFGLPGHWLLGARQFGQDAIEQWKRVYGANTTWSLMSAVQTMPTLANYANYHMRHLNGRQDSATFLIEGSANLFGSVSTEHVTRPAMQRYAGMIQTYLLMYLQNGGRATATPYGYTLYGARATQQATVPIAEGGTLIQSTTEAPLTFRRYDLNGVSVNVTSMEAPLLVAPAMLYVSVTGMIRSLGNAAGRHGLYINIDGSNDSHSRTTVGSTATALEGANFALLGYRLYQTLDPDTVPSVSLGVRKISGGDAELYNASMTITIVPHAAGHMAPRLDGA